MYALMSLGLVLVHRVSTTINFAQGAIAMVGTYVYWDIYGHTSFWVAYPIALAATSVLGALIYLFIIRPLRNSSQTARLLATLGVLATITAGCQPDISRRGGDRPLVPPVPAESTSWAPRWASRSCGCSASRPA